MLSPLGFNFRCCAILITLLNKIDELAKIQKDTFTSDLSVCLDDVVFFPNT